MLGFGKKQAAPDPSDTASSPMDFEIKTFDSDLAHANQGQPMAPPEPINTIKPGTAPTPSPFLNNQPAAPAAPKEPAPKPKAPVRAETPPKPLPSATLSEDKSPSGFSLPNLESVMAKHETPAHPPVEKPLAAPEKPLASAITPPAEPGRAAAPVTPLERKSPLMNGFQTPQSGIMSPDFMSDTPSGPETESKVSKWLLIAAVVVLVLTLVAGLYYYFAVYRSNSDTSSQEPSITEPSITDADNPQMPPIKPDTPANPPVSALPTPLTDTNILSMKAGENVLIAFKNQASFLKTTTLEPEKKFYTIKNDQSTALTAKDIISGMGLKLDELLPNVAGAWAYFHPQTAQNVKLGLVFEITPAGTDITNTVKSLESQLPTKLAGMFIDDQVMPPAAATFADSKYDPRVRYTVLSDTSSIDWAVVTADGQSFLLIGTSKDTMQNMLNLLGL